MPKALLYAIAVSGVGAIIGSTVSLMAIFLIPDIGGGLSIRADDAGWLNTVYNVGSLFGLPVVMTLVAALGRGRAMFWAGLMFTLASVLVAVSPSYGWALVARLVHGFFGGMLPVLMMSVVLSSLFPNRGQLEGLTLFALATSVGVGFAGLLGGGLANAFDWRALFWVQGLAGAVYTGLAAFALRHERGDLGYLVTKDWASYAFLSGGLSCLLIVISEGERHFWLEAWWIPGLMVAGLIGVAYGGHNLWVAKRPLLALSVFRKPTFAWAMILSAFFRFGSLLAVWIAPQYLARLQGYKAWETGLLLLAMLSATILGSGAGYWLVKRVDPRLLLTAGLGAFAAASFLCASLGPDWAADQLRIAAVLAGFGQAIFQVALLRYAVIGIGREEGPTCGVVFNAGRLFGLIGGLAALWHFVNEREKLHSAALIEGMAVLDPEVQQRLASGAAGLGVFTTDAAAARGGAVGNLARAASNQAFTLAYGDAFLVTAVCLAIGAILVWALPSVAEATRRQSPPVAIPTS